MSNYLQLENRILKLELRVIELENQLAQARGSSNNAAPAAPTSPNVVPPASGNTFDNSTPPTDEEIRSYQKVRGFMNLLGACR